MRNTLRLIALLLCLVLLTTCVFASNPISLPSETGAPPETTDASEPDAEPVEPDADSEPVTEPTEPVTEPTEPVTEPTEPVTEPTEPVTEPTEPVTEPTEPVTEPTEPTEPEPTDPPEPPEPPISEMTDEQIIAKFNIPNNYARDALVFAVRSGLMVGKGDGDLAPLDSITHAEIVTILNNVLKTRKMAPVDKYTDVEHGSWYEGQLAKAVSLGILPLADPSATKLTPGKPITREEAFVYIARYLGVHGYGRQAIYRFSDWKKIHDWAADDVSAVIETCGLVGDGVTLYCDSNITRQDFAVVVHHLLDKIDDHMDTQSFTGKFALGSSYVAPNTTVNGDLILSTDDTELNLQGLTVTGRLVIQGNDKVVIRMTGCSINELILCRDADLYSDRQLNSVTNYRLVRLFCNVKTVNVYGNLVLTAGCTVDNMNVWQKNFMTISGTVKNMTVYANSVYINGSGVIEKLTKIGRNLTNSCQTNQTVTNYNPNVKEIVGTAYGSWTVTEANPNVTIKVKLTNMPAGIGEYDVVWHVNGQEFSRKERVLLKENDIISATRDFSSRFDGYHSRDQINVYVIDRTGLKGCVLVDWVQLNLADVAAKIRTQNVEAKVNVNCKLYTSMNLSSVSRSNVPAGTQVIVLQSREETATKIRLPDGTVGWTQFLNLTYSGKRFYTDQDYPQDVKEYYVNHVRNCSSQTQYLVWVSLYCQQVNIFQGSKGNWHLIQTGPVATGLNYCPTPVEQVKIYGRTYMWDQYTNFYVHNVSYFDEARAFHSRPKSKVDGSVYNPAIGYPASAGCIRMLDEECIFIYNNCTPKTSNNTTYYTAVYIY